jgi:Zn-dependent peptidase ImmA (M78 family)
MQNDFPVPLEKVLQHLGFQWHLFEPDEKNKDISGAVDHRKHVVYSNGSESIYRQRFTVAHEVGHIVLHSGENIVDRRNVFFESYDQKEYAANIFAAELLMPIQEFKKAWNKLDGDRLELSRYFGVTGSAIDTRAYVLNLASF